MHMRPVAKWRGLDSLNLSIGDFMKTGRCLVALKLAVLSAAFFLASASFVTAQQDQGCILDHCADRVPLPKSETIEQPVERNPDANLPRPRGASLPGDFDFYVLALSWSPGFCESSGASKARSQCDVGANLGFVVHGLWPQYQHGYPSDCGQTSRWPSRIALQSTQGLYPDEGLARYEWRKHGTCSGKSPNDYFADVRRAREAITIPTPFTTPHDAQNWTPIDIQRAFLAANQRLRPGMMAVECVRGTLQEVRICFSKDLRNFVECPEVSRAFCRTSSVAVPPMR
jgi:ribonuclease T2